MNIAVISVNALVFLTCAAATSAPPPSEALALVVKVPATATAALTRATEEVTAAAAAIVAAFGRHDPDAYFALFAPEATFVFYTAPNRFDSRAEYEAEWAKWEKENGFRV